LERRETSGIIDSMLPALFSFIKSRRWIRRASAAATILALDGAANAESSPSPEAMTYKTVDGPAIAARDI